MILVLASEWNQVGGVKALTGQVCRESGSGVVNQVRELPTHIRRQVFRVIFHHHNHPACNKE